MADNRKSNFESLLAKELARPTHERILESPYPDQEIRAVKNPTIYSIGETIDKNPITRFLGSGLSDYLKTVGKGGRAGFGKSLMAALDVAGGAPKVGGAAVGIVKSKLPMFKSQVKVRHLPKSKQYEEASRNLRSYITNEGIHPYPDLIEPLLKNRSTDEARKFKKFFIKKYADPFDKAVAKEANLNTGLAGVQNKILEMEEVYKLDIINKIKPKEGLGHLKIKDFEQFSAHQERFLKANPKYKKLQKEKSRLQGLIGKEQANIQKLDNEISEYLIDKATDDFFTLKVQNKIQGPTRSYLQSIPGSSARDYSEYGGYDVLDYLEGNFTRFERPTAYYLKWIREMKKKAKRTRD